LDDIDLIKASLPGHDALVHNAIHWEVQPTELELQDTKFAAKLFEAAASAGVEQTIFTSSTAVHRPLFGTMNELSPIRPNDYYGATKAAGELFLSAVSHQFDMRCNVLRLGPVVGAPAFSGAPFKTDRRFQDFLSSAIRGEELLVTKGEVRQFVGAKDVARVFLALLESFENRQTIICAAEQPTSWVSIAVAVVEEIGSSSRVVTEGDAENQPPLFDVSKLDTVLGFRLDSSIALRDHIEYIVKDNRCAI